MGSARTHHSPIEAGVCHRPASVWRRVRFVRAEHRGQAAPRAAGSSTEPARFNGSRSTRTTDIPMA